MKDGMPYTHHLDATAGQLTVVGSGKSDFRETEAAIRWPADHTPSFEEARAFVAVFKSQRTKLQDRSP